MDADLIWADLNSSSFAVKNLHVHNATDGQVLRVFVSIQCQFIFNSIYLVVVTFLFSVTYFGVLTCYVSYDFPCTHHVKFWFLIHSGYDCTNVNLLETPINLVCLDIVLFCIIKIQNFLLCACEILRFGLFWKVGLLKSFCFSNLYYGNYHLHNQFISSAWILLIKTFISFLIVIV